MKYPKENNENSNDSINIDNINSTNENDNNYPSGIQGLFERLGLE